MKRSANVSPAMMRQSIWDYFVDKPFDLMMNDLSGTIDWCVDFVTRAVPINVN